MDHAMCHKWEKTIGRIPHGKSKNRDRNKFNAYRAEQIKHA